MIYSGNNQKVIFLHLHFTQSKTERNLKKSNFRGFFFFFFCLENYRNLKNLRARKKSLNISRLTKYHRRGCAPIHYLASCCQAEQTLQNLHVNMDPQCYPSRTPTSSPQRNIPCSQSQQRLGSWNVYRKSSPQALSRNISPRNLCSVTGNTLKPWHLSVESQGSCCSFSLPVSRIDLVSIAPRFPKCIFRFLQVEGLWWPVILKRWYGSSERLVYF